eukprot:TRINITY_DN50213_c0_g1_i1.p2 TRINITY_DN50213_c0_g1~~TRINITY_DN50213_c0_g1_i1.p2  ORF type:complete len:518 (+),score=126.60 TRINITY_DN50213_c0_g1_i1:82-1554(+)
MMRRRGSGGFRELDAFRRVSADLAESSVPGGLFTLCAVAVCGVLLVCECTSFFEIQTRTRLIVDSSTDLMLRINFDIHVHDLACEYTSVGVWDSFGTDRINLSTNIYKQRIDHTGEDKGHPYTAEELDDLDREQPTAEELRELDSDWTSANDHHQHESFEQVIQAHDFTFVFFYLRSTKSVQGVHCAPCKAWRPVWEEFEAIVNEGREDVVRVVRDADGRQPRMRAIRVNCADFQEMCVEQHVSNFPSIRLYRRGHAHRRFTPYDHGRDVQSLIGFMRAEVAKVHTQHTGVHVHNVFKEGCRLRGFIDVHRVPGTVHIEARHARDRHLNYATTNVSHTIRHLSFGNSGFQLSQEDVGKHLPQEFRKSVAPLDGRSFVTHKFHQAPHHFLKVVATTLAAGDDPTWRFTEPSLRSYQMTHQYHVTTFPRTATPQAKISYDLSPVEVVVTRERGRHWYDFLTTIFAGIGGTFSTFAIISALSGGLARKLFGGR